LVYLGLCSHRICFWS